MEDESRGGKAVAGWPWLRQLVKAFAGPLMSLAPRADRGSMVGLGG
jgi:hypothetical protein